MKLYKILGKNGEACHGGSGVWNLPKGKRPGKWMPRIDGDIIPCATGYHLCREGDLTHWLDARIYEAEYKGELVEDDNKVVVRQARLVRRLDTWNDRTPRIFAADCAERVLNIYERDYPNDSRVRNAIEISRKVANGDLPISELAAAGPAAGAAVWDAAQAAAWAAACAAARNAACAAARNAARNAAWAAARNAACAAACAAARNATRAAVWDATRAAVWDAAWDAAWNTEKEWQTARLMEYLQGKA